MADVNAEASNLSEAAENTSEGPTSRRPTTIEEAEDKSLEAKKDKAMAEREEDSTVNIDGEDEAGSGGPTEGYQEVASTEMPNLFADSPLGQLSMAFEDQIEDFPTDGQSS